MLHRPPISFCSKFQVCPSQIDHPIQLKILRIFYGFLIRCGERVEIAVGVLGMEPSHWAGWPSEEDEFVLLELLRKKMRRPLKNSNGIEEVDVVFATIPHFKYGSRSTVFNYLINHLIKIDFRPIYFSTFMIFSQTKHESFNSFDTHAQLLIGMQL